MEPDQSTVKNFRISKVHQLLRFLHIDERCSFSQEVCIDLSIEHGHPLSCLPNISKLLIQVEENCSEEAAFAAI